MNLIRLERCDASKMHFRILPGGYLRYACMAASRMSSPNRARCCRRLQSGARMSMAQSGSGLGYAACNAALSAGRPGLQEVGFFRIVDECSCVKSSSL